MPTARAPSGRPTPPVAGALRRPRQVLASIAEPGARVVVLGLEEVPDDDWSVLTASQVRVLHLPDAPAVLEAMRDGAAGVVIADGVDGPPLARAVRADPRLSSVHIVICAPLESREQLRAALESGADDVMRLPFEAEVLAARVGAGFRAARLRAGEAFLASLVANIPGAVYRCACDPDWTMQWLSDEIETITGYPASDFIASATRTFASVIYAGDRDEVERVVRDGVEARRPYSIEYRIVRRDGSMRWVLERGQLQDAGDGRRWLDGAIFDITARRAAEEALRDRQITAAQLAEVRASRARIIDAADRARRDIERDLHDGAQQRLVSVALRLRLWLNGHRDLPEESRRGLEETLAELHAGMAELRELAQGLHPSVLSDRGLEHALAALALRAPVPVEVRTTLDGGPLPIPAEAAAYFTVAEALTNVAKHASATRAWVVVERRDGHLDVEIGDDGRGGATAEIGSGLQGLRDRIGAVNGRLDVESPPSAGTILRARLPLSQS